MKVTLDITGKSFKVTPDITRKYESYTRYSGVHGKEKTKDLRSILG